MLKATIFALSLLLIVSFSMSVSAEITDDMIVAAWVFDGDAKDISENGFDGELQGGNLLMVKSAKRLS